MKDRLREDPLPWILLRDMTTRDAPQYVLAIDPTGEAHMTENPREAIHFVTTNDAASVRSSVTSPHSLDIIVTVNPLPEGPTRLERAAERVRITIADHAEAAKQLAEAEAAQRQEIRAIEREQEAQRTRQHKVTTAVANAKKVEADAAKRIGDARRELNAIAEKG